MSIVTCMAYGRHNRHYFNEPLDRVILQTVEDHPESERKINMTNDQDRSLQMLSAALEMEKKGVAFYKEAVSTCQNKMGREIFLMLMKDEGLHADRILKIYDSLKAGKPWPEDWKSIKPDHKDLSVLFREMASSHGKNITANTSDLEALDMGIDLELRSITFYKESLKKAQDPLEQEFIKQMIGEENSHHAILSDMKVYLADPAGWFFEHEHTGLDGV